MWSVRLPAVISTNNSIYCNVTSLWLVEEVPFETEPPNNSINRCIFAVDVVIVALENVWNARLQQLAREVSVYDRVVPMWSTIVRKACVILLLTDTLYN